MLVHQEPADYRLLLRMLSDYPSHMEPDSVTPSTQLLLMVMHSTRYPFVVTSLASDHCLSLYLSDRARHFSNRCDICKVAKVVHGN